MFYKNRSKSLFDKILYWVLPAFSIVCLLYAYTRAVKANPMVMPGFAEIGERFLDLSTKPIKGVTIWGHVLASLRRVLVGAAASWVIGIFLGVFTATNRYMNATVGTLITIIRPIPGVAWVPLIVVAFGIGEFPKYLLVFIGCIFTMVQNTYSGVYFVDQSAIKVGKMFGANKFQILTNFIIPTAIPAIFAGIRLSVSNGWKIVLAAEMMGATLGIGAMVTRGWNELDMATVICCVVIIAVTGALLSVAVNAIERVLTPWNR